MLKKIDFHALRQAISAIPADVSNDAVGENVPKLEDMFAPETHAAALDPATPIVVGARGTGKSFWSGVLGQDATRKAAAKAYPNLGLDRTRVGFGFTGGVGGPLGVTTEMLNSAVSQDASAEVARAFWWSTILRAAARGINDAPLSFKEAIRVAGDWELRGELLDKYEDKFQRSRITLLVVYDALDTVASTWPRRRLLTEALLEVVWAMRAYRHIKVKLFLRPDQIDDDALRFIELPKLRTGAIRLNWSKSDLYGLLYARLILSNVSTGRLAFTKLLKELGIAPAQQNAILARQWSLAHKEAAQSQVMEVLAGAFMGEGVNGHKKGKTYDWPVKHLADAFAEVTPRSFLGLVIAAAKYGGVPDDRAITSEGIRHGLRAASKTRVDQLHQEFLWIKGVLAPLAGLLLPQNELEVFKAWKKTRTLAQLSADAKNNKYLPPFEIENKSSEKDIFLALERIGVMFSRKDGRLDMPDLFRVAAKLLKKGGTAPV
ncbi:hypothetical protein ACGLHS_23795 [Variovorax sp. VaC1]|uniref:hypothetical protein n=1 Tax=Variovorax sp. VaC1 TaxID=3373132 RepID=UPI0037485204